MAWAPVRAAESRPVRSVVTSQVGRRSRGTTTFSTYRRLGIDLACITAGAYYNPHVQRPAFFPPSDSYTRRKIR
jgi:hypothetical protein